MKGNTPPPTAVSCNLKADPRGPLLNIIRQAPYDLEPEDWASTDQRMSTFDIFDLDMKYFFEKFVIFKEKLTKRFRKPKNLCSLVEPRTEETCKPGDEMTQELTDAWNLYTRVLGYFIIIS